MGEKLERSYKKIKTYLMILPFLLYTYQTFSKFSTVNVYYFYNWKNITCYLFINVESGTTFLPKPALFSYPWHSS